MIRDPYGLLATTGAAVAGLGIGALAQPWIGRSDWVVAMAGLVSHAVGMAGKNRAGSSLLDKLLYRGCWLALAALVTFLLLRGLLWDL